MESIKNLLILYAGIVLVNAVLSLALWRVRRTKLHRSVFLLWSATMLTFLAQGILSSGTDISDMLGFSFVFLMTLALAGLLDNLISQKTTWRMYVVVMLVCTGCSVAASMIGLPFVVAALPVSFGGSFPMIHVLITRVRKAYRQLTFSGKGLTITSAIYVLHIMDFPFLRHVAEFAPYGFTIAALLVVALTLFAPSVALEIVTAREARVSAEMDVAKRIQTEILPNNPELPGYEIECFMQPADEVGGDYYDVYTNGESSWILIGDVTGHGLSSGLVMLMAQSIITSILHTRENLTPTELNALANKVLFKNLVRLNERRTMTIASLRQGREHEFTLSGSHDNVFIWRTETRKVEVVPVDHFPCGLGLKEGIEGKIRPETTIRLAPQDLLFLATDGVTEAARRGEYSGGVFDESGVVGFLEERGHQPLEQMKDELMNRLELFTRGIYHDDITFVMIRQC